MTLDICLIKQQGLFFVTNLSAFMLYTYNYLVDSSFFHPLCELE